MSGRAALEETAWGGDPLVAFFDRGAWGYDLQLPLERRALRAAAAAAEPLGGARVVDLAAGTGALTIRLVERRHPPASITLVDAAPRMLRRARAKLRRRQVAARYIVADARSVPLPDACADVVSIGYLLHLLDPSPRTVVIDEARRLLAPGGRLIAVVHGSPPGVAGAVYRRGWRLLRLMAPRGVVGHGPIADLAPLLEARGLQVLSSRRLPGVYWSQVVEARAPIDATPSAG